MPPAILQFEQRVLRQHFGGQSLDDWERDPNYHAYLNMSALCGSDVASLGQAYLEYRHWPAPTASGRRSSPVQQGEHSIAFARVAMAFGPRAPMPGGRVTHYVELAAHALANATDANLHVLHPGYIIRWCQQLGPAIVSWTLGRGTGALPDNNVIYGVRMFHDLDQRIRSQLESRRASASAPQP